ncbi:hypothetical protein HOP62_02565 [Halomonas sp. MCCC 1A17488]|uniref:hypothetical protein n=1 Tax=unclassified Halomonas TaxID=2609666 RepID=UPI0018D265E4|nr:MULTISPECIES: hypothetical protein [unclassified Halomonas]MCE8014957.1 hypothetical protein [Halomonas sp. MCCC 1A17488]MCG3238290.1 hypothetical protein [Halomonas sp. MCCC 1A17488]QPP47954.1 hypothetical protein I4484_11835 [Halomonas sp. SS10-MC5]
MTDLSAPMTYLLVMGSVALSVLFTLGWAFSRLLRWLAAGLPLGGGKAGRKPAKRSGATRQAGAAKASRSANAGSRRKAKAKAGAKPPSEPWALTRRLAEWRSSIAMALVAAPTYLVARLVEHGMSFRPPHNVPSGFTTLVIVLGWLAAGLILLALLHRLAVWRCR